MANEEDDKKPTAETVKLVTMKRVLRKGESGPTTANVHPKEVRNYEEGGWAKA